MKNEETVTGNIRLSLEGKQIEIQMTVPAKPVKPQRLLPIFQQITNQFVALAEKEVEEAGEKITCAKGCGACCRQVVPIAEVDAFQLAELVENLPEPRGTEIKTRFDNAWQHFAKIGWFGRLAHFGADSIEERQKVALDYFYEGVPCPFLEDESCSIHQDRPLGCREYLVTSPVEHCSKPTAETVKMLKIPVKSSNTLRNISNTANLDSKVNFVPLIFALEWAKRYSDDFPEKTGQEWMADFFTNLTKKEIPESAKS